MTVEPAQRKHRRTLTPDERREIATRYLEATDKAAARVELAEEYDIHPDTVKNLAGGASGAASGAADFDHRSNGATGSCPWPGCTQPARWSRVDTRRRVPESFWVCFEHRAGDLSELPPLREGNAGPVAATLAMMVVEYPEGWLLRDAGRALGVVPSEVARVARELGLPVMHGRVWPAPGTATRLRAPEPVEPARCRECSRPALSPDGLCAECHEERLRQADDEDLEDDLDDDEDLDTDADSDPTGYRVEAAPQSTPGSVESGPAAVGNRSAPHLGRASGGTHPPGLVWDQMVDPSSVDEADASSPPTGRRETAGAPAPGNGPGQARSLTREPVGGDEAPELAPLVRPSPLPSAEGTGGPLGDTATARPPAPGNPPGPVEVAEVAGGPAEPEQRVTPNSGEERTVTMPATKRAQANDEAVVAYVEAAGPAGCRLLDIENGTGLSSSTVRRVLRGHPGRLVAKGSTTARRVYAVEHIQPAKPRPNTRLRDPALVLAAVQAADPKVGLTIAELATATGMGQQSVRRCIDELGDQVRVVAGAGVSRPMRVYPVQESPAPRPPPPPEVQEGRYVAEGPGALGTLDELLDVLAELEDEVLENIYGIKADCGAPLDVAVLAWRRAGCPRPSADAAAAAEVARLRVRCDYAESAYQDALTALTRVTAERGRAIAEAKQTRLQLADADAYTESLRAKVVGPYQPPQLDLGLVHQRHPEVAAALIRGLDQARARVAELEAALAVLAGAQPVEVGHG